MIVVGAHVLVIEFGPTRIGRSVPVVGGIAAASKRRQIVGKIGAPRIVDALEMCVGRGRAMTRAAVTEPRHARVGRVVVVVRGLIARAHASRVLAPVVVHARQRARETLGLRDARTPLRVAATILASLRLRVPVERARLAIAHVVYAVLFKFDR